MLWLFVIPVGLYLIAYVGSPLGLQRDTTPKLGEVRVRPVQNGKVVGEGRHMWNGSAWVKQS